jgi:hypothetical protein
MAFQKAVKTKAKGRIAVTGPSGAGKTLTSLLIARGMVGPTGRIAAIDSEFGSMSKYADRFEFDVMELEGDYHPTRYLNAIKDAEAAGYDACIVDSLTHAWNGTKDVVDKKKMADRNSNGFTAWSDGTKLWDALQNAIMGSKMHVIVTMRSKTAYSQEKDDKTGKTVVRKLGMEPETRDGTEFAFDVVLDMDVEHWGRVSKTRCDALDGYAQLKPGAALGETLAAWLGDGAVKAPPAPPPPPPKLRDVDFPAYMAKLRAKYDADCVAAAKTLGNPLPDDFESGPDWDETSYINARAALQKIIDYHHSQNAGAQA